MSEEKNQTVSAPLQGEGQNTQQMRGRSFPLSLRKAWLKATPYFLSGALFLSLLFSVFAPLPLLVVRYQRAPLLLRVLSTATNSALVFALGGRDALGLYVWTVLPIVWVLPYLLERLKRLETAVLLATGSILLLAIGLVSIEAISVKMSPIQYVLSAVDEGLRRVYESVPPSNQESLLDGLTLEEWMAMLKRDIPWRVVTFCLFWVFANTLILLRWNPSHLRERLGLQRRFFADWRVPDALIWPVVVFGALSVFAPGVWGTLGMNVLYVLLGVFGIQGLSVLSFVLDHWKVQGPFRALLFGMAILILSPLVLGIGFFDTWFDFRARLRQK